MQVTYEAKIKEKGNPHVLTPSYTGDSETVNEEFLIKFWGLNEQDVESYEIIKVD
jgi:hypothetical protein